MFGSLKSVFLKTQPITAAHHAIFPHLYTHLLWLVGVFLHSSVITTDLVTLHALAFQSSKLVNQASIFDSSFIFSSERS